MNITCVEGVIENQKEYMQPIVNVDDVELALDTDNASGKCKLLILDHFVFYRYWFLDLPDVSLVTNKLRSVTMPKEETESSSEISVKTDMSLSTITQNRTWSGLNPYDSRPPIIKATEGRKGTPSTGYIVTNLDHRS